MITANRYHDISVGHRVVGHESKCRHLHGHNYRIHFEISAAALDGIGRVLDFSVIKSRLCMWVEENWDHKFLASQDDPLFDALLKASVICNMRESEFSIFDQSLVLVPFNPTAENMAQYLVDVIGPQQLEGTGCILQRVVIEETRKCSASFTKGK